MAEMTRALTALSEWEQGCEASLRRSRERRQGGPHPWPEPGAWTSTLLGAVVFAAGGFALLVAAAALVSP